MNCLLPCSPLGSWLQPAEEVKYTKKLSLRFHSSLNITEKENTITLILTTAGESQFETKDLEYWIINLILQKFKTVMSFVGFIIYNTSDFYLEIQV